MYGGPGDRGWARLTHRGPAPQSQTDDSLLQQFQQGGDVSYGYLQPQFVQMQPMAAVQGTPGAPEFAHGQPYLRHQQLHFPPSLAIGSPPPFRHQPLSPGPIPPFPPPVYAHPPPLTHSPPHNFHPVTLQSYPQVSVIPGTQASLQHPPAFHGHHLPAGPFGVTEQTYPLSHPMQAYTPQQGEMPHHCIQHGSDLRSGSHVIVRPIPIYRTPAPGFEALIRQGLSQASVAVTCAQQQTVEAQVVEAPPEAVQSTSGMAASVQPQTSETMLSETGSEQEPATPPALTLDLSDPMEGSSTMAREVDEYHEFAKAFKDLRSKLGYSEADVSQQIGLRYGYKIRPGEITQFESQGLDMDEVRKLKPVLETWVRDTAKAAGGTDEEINEIVTAASTLPKRPRRARTSLNPLARERLEYEFQQKPKPTQAEMAALADTLGVEKSFVRIWFCNRRQRQKRRDKKLTSTGSPTSSVTDITTIQTISSPSHDITLEVPAGSEEAILPSTADVYITQSSSSQNMPFEDF